MTQLSLLQDSVDEIEFKLKHDINVARNWLNANKLSLIVLKTKGHALQPP